MSHSSRSHNTPGAWERTGLGAFGIAHRRLLPPQFLRNSLKKTRGSNWSLRLSKELNNQIESFDSPSLEKVCVHSVRATQTGRGLQGWWNGGSDCVRPAAPVAVYRVLGGEVGDLGQWVFVSCFVLL